MYKKESFCILMIFFLIYLSNYSFAQPLVKVWKSDNAYEIQNYAELYLRLLGVREDIFINIAETTNIPKKMDGITFSVDFPKPDVYQYFRVWINANL